MAIDRDAAIKSFEQSLDLARRTGDDASVSAILLKLSTAYLESREFNKSLVAAEEAIAAARQAGDRKQEAWALIHAGNALYSMGKFARALENFRAAVPLMRDVRDRLGEALALKDAGILCKYLRRYDEAFGLMNEALEIFRELNEGSGILSTLHNIGIGYAMLDADRLALEAYEEALKVARENNDRAGECHVLIRIGYLVRDRELGLEYLDQALALAEELKLYDLQVEVLNGMSDALAETGQLDRAIEAQKRALKINLRWNSRMAVELNGLGHLYLERDPALAARYFRRSLAAAREESDSPLVISPHYGLAEAYRRQGDLDLAIEHYQQAIDAIESIRTQLISDQHRATFSGQYQRIYTGLIEALMERHERDPEAGDDRRAFAILERAKARSLVEAIREARLDVGQELDEDLSRREKQLNARIAELQKRLIQSEVSAGERRELQQDLSQAEQEFERLQVESKMRNPHYAAFSYPGPLSIGEAQRLLDNRTAILAYLVTKESVVAFIITSSIFQTARLSVPAHIVRARVQNYVDLIDREDNDGWQEISRRLYAEFVAPIRKHLSSEVDRLVVIPDDALHYLAFETLIQDAESARSDPSRYLLEDFTISYAPSATVLTELVASASDAPTSERADMAVFADPAFAPALLVPDASPLPSNVARSLYAEEGLQVTRIPFSAAEARAIEQYAGRGSKIYTGAEASESRIKADQLDRFRVIHFATHGLISQQMPARSALVLAPGGDEDGFLQVREIYELKLKSDLVVLSACQTARGQLLAGDGVRGLAQSFFQAGVKSVVASLWDVNDERTALFMSSFYRHLADQKSKAEALRAAKIEMLRQGPTSSPRYWAAFILIGEANGRVSVGRTDWFGGWLPVCVPLSLIALIALFLIRRKIKSRQERGGRQVVG
ncbi:MAG: CHAT domain-containing tetratricopeptide repeat protein [Acidobacteriota bacterium]